MGMLLRKREPAFANNMPWHGNGASLFSCDLEVEKASEVKTASERNLAKGDYSRMLYTILLEMIEF